MIKIEKKDIIDTLVQMHDDVFELYNCDTIYSVSLNVAIDTLNDSPVKDYYWADIY